DAAKIAKVEELLNKGDAERKSLHQKMKKSRKALRSLVRDDSTDEDAFEEAVGTLLKTRKRLHDMRHAELNKLRRVLTSKEMGKLVLVLGRLRHKMERRRGHGGRDRGDRGFRRGPRDDDDFRRGRRDERGPRDRRRDHRDDW
ncbi:MAG: hypothetical protein QF464_19550, partial [Myxococcota bacterium]|nr:hypothetical protein [Myxococcota bacterium]